MKRNLVLAVLISAISMNHMLEIKTRAASNDVDKYEFKSFRDECKDRLEEYQVTLEEEVLEVARCMIEEESYEIECYEEVYEDEYIEETYVQEVYVNYNPYNLLEPSNITREQAYQILEGTALQSLSNAYVYMEELYGVNAIWLMALNAEESGWGRSGLAISNNNLGGVKSRDGGWATFSDWGDCLEFITNMIRYEYLSEDGLFYNGVSIWDVNTKYCEGTQWAENLNAIAYSLLNKCY